MKRGSLWCIAILICAWLPVAYDRAVSLSDGFAPPAMTLELLAAAVGIFLATAALFPLSVLHSFLAILNGDADALLTLNGAMFSIIFLGFIFTRKVGTTEAPVVISGCVSLGFFLATAVLRARQY